MPIGKGHRMQKLRTEKQRIAAKAYATPITIEPTNAGLPDRSWWLEPRTREEFDQVAARQRERMRESSFGRPRVAP